MRSMPEVRIPASLLPLSFGIALAGASSTARAQARPQADGTLGVSDCVAVALRDNPDSQSSEDAVREAEADRAATGGGFGPKVHLDALVQRWNSTFILPFPIPDGRGNPTSNFTVRDAFTWMAGATVTQPLSALFAIYDEYKVQDLGVDVASIRRAATRREVAFRAIESYYRLLEAGRLADVANASVTQLEAQQKQAQSQFDNGILGKNDLLRAALALAGAKQRAIQTRGQVVVARGRLAAAMGVPPTEELAPKPFIGEPPIIGEPALESAEAHAVAQRLELRGLAREVDQAESSVAFAKKKLWPTISAVGNYTHAEGSQFQQVDSAYLGLAGSWDVWDWGTTLAGIREADARLSRSAFARKKLEDQVRLEAREAFVNAESAREALDVARSAVSQGEENYRIVTKKFDNNAATSFDLVDAEALLTEARGQVEQALYDYLIACAALQKATGSTLPGDGM